jgi:hypothetical protein
MRSRGRNARSFSGRGRRYQFASPKSTEDILFMKAQEQQRYAPHSSQPSFGYNAHGYVGSGGGYVSAAPGQYPTNAHHQPPVSPLPQVHQPHSWGMSHNHVASHWHAAPTQHVAVFTQDIPAQFQQHHLVQGHCQQNQQIHRPYSSRESINGHGMSPVVGVSGTCTNVSVQNESSGMHENVTMSSMMQFQPPDADAGPRSAFSARQETDFQEVTSYEDALFENAFF